MYVFSGSNSIFVNYLYGLLSILIIKSFNILWVLSKFHLVLGIFVNIFGYAWTLANILFLHDVEQ